MPTVAVLTPHLAEQLAEQLANQLAEHLAIAACHRRHFALDVGGVSWPCHHVFIAASLHGGMVAGFLIGPH
ncbi:MAG: hypothetical protein KKH21_02655 [Gammaproteobacteria bacterium]|nr:hypothetical protein [Gammaproteobacteria bacterium]